MALYASRLFVVNSSPFDTSQFDTDNNTAMMGLGARLRIRPSTYICGEITPRLSGYRPGCDQGSVGHRDASGGHTFQINFSNGFGTTLGNCRAAASAATRGTSASTFRESSFRS
jgi:hypothetical protein